MGLAHSPKVVTDGLVFAYDQGNTDKSWKGAPTTNIVTNWNLDTGWSQGYCTDIIFNEIAPPYGVDAPTVGFRDADGNGSGYWYSYGNYAPGQTPGSTMTVSLYVKISGPDCSIRCYTADNSETGRVYGSYITVSQSERWKRCVWTIVIPNPSTSESLSFQFEIPSTTRMWLCAPQMESGSFATPFVAGTRSSTQAILDLTRQNTVTATSLTYASDGTFSFDGSNDGIACSATASSLGITTDFTISIFTKRASSPTNALQGQAGFGSGGSVSFKNNTNYFADVYSATPTRYVVNITSAGSMTPYENVWVNLCVTVSGTSIKTFLNGTLAGSSTMDTTIKSFGSEVFGVGVGYGYYRLQGEAAIASVYNRALTDAEVQQNFNAHRGRYGV